MNRFTLWHKAGIQLFYKVVNIIQEHILQAHVIYCIVFYYYYAKSTQKSKMLQRYTKVNLINQSCINKVN
jgi:hypothetical protein